MRHWYIFPSFFVNVVVPPFRTLWHLLLASPYIQSSYSWYKWMCLLSFLFCFFDCMVDENRLFQLIACFAPLLISFRFLWKPLPAFWIMFRTIVYSIIVIILAILIETSMRLKDLLLDLNICDPCIKVTTK